MSKNSSEDPAQARPHKDDQAIEMSQEFNPGQLSQTSNQREADDSALLRDITIQGSETIGEASQFIALKHEAPELLQPYFSNFLTQAQHEREEDVKLREIAEKELSETIVENRSSEKREWFATIAQWIIVSIATGTGLFKVYENDLESAILCLGFTIVLLGGPAFLQILAHGTRLVFEMTMNNSLSKRKNNDD